MPGRNTGLIDLCPLDDAASMHHRHAVRDVQIRVQVVGHEQAGQAKLLLKVQEQGQDLRLNRDARRRDRLVGEDGEWAVDASRRAARMLQGGVADK